METKCDICVQKWEKKMIELKKKKKHTCTVSRNLRATLRKLNLVTMPDPGPRPR